jgi:hypothetical protein
MGDIYTSATGQNIIPPTLSAALYSLTPDYDPGDGARPGWVARPIIQLLFARPSKSVDREMSSHQTVLEDAAAAVREVALSGKTFERAAERLWHGSGCGRDVLR